MLNSGIELMSLGVEGESNDSPPPPKSKKEKAKVAALQAKLRKEAGVPTNKNAEERKLLIPVFCTVDVPSKVCQSIFHVGE
jgi:hypothetical protein